MSRLVDDSHDEPIESPHRLPGAPTARAEMTFLEHLDALRGVLLHVVIATALGAIGGWLLSPRVLEDLIARTVGTAYVLSPLEAFNERFKLALLIGALLTGPFIFYRIWAFVVPGLLKRERGMILPLALVSMLLFAGGLAAAYYYVVPMIVRVLAGFTVPGMLMQIRVSDLLGFFYNVAIACGVIAQLPVVTMTLTALGLVTPGMLLKQWRYALIGAFILTAVITPGDVVTAQLILGGPMAALYFVSVGLSWFVARRRRPEPDPEEV
ncbi:MAG: twin-arginine translocase subunit TatC [Candidatus Eisenbacteria bacterium]|uniref:Sec-independent protein translocase protein TatC n=1 Tax=Eiseniibacteriota bacterium TaxID=2212470 RepID=A0A849SR33_UNCEI|nr:twin-arginine translocase subunit TatC [Candidatus Eisenbacteria bacterium]